MKKQDVIDSIIKFRDGYKDLNKLWHHFDLNALGAVSQYPFESSFDEYDVATWCDEMLEELKRRLDYNILSTTYMNTGGHCMVHNSCIYLAAENKTIYVYCNEDGGSIYTVDYMQNEIEYEDEMCIYSVSWDCLDSTDGYYEMLQTCRVAWLQSAYKDGDGMASIRYSQLPHELKMQIADKHVKWLEESDDWVDTDGVNVIIPSLDEDSDMNAAKQLRTFMNDEFASYDENQEAFYNMDFTIGFGDQTIKLNNNADVFSAIDSCLRAIEEL